MSVRVERYEGGAAAWDAFVRGREGWTHYHLHGWRDVMQRVYGHECLYLEARGADGALRGVLPLVRVRSALFGHYLVSMPFLNYGGPLGDDEAVRALVARAAEIARADRVKLLELRSRAPLPIDLPVSHRKITVVLDLPPDAKTLFAGFDSNVRRRVRRSQKAGVTVRFGLDQVVPFYEVFARHMRDLGTPSHSRRLFETVAEVFPDAWFGCAYHEEQPIAGIGGFVWGSEFEVTWASALIAYKEMAANMHLYWAFMERAIDERLTTFNFGRCTPDGGTHRFKKQWGSRDEALWWYGLSRHEGVTTPSPEHGAYAWGPRLWRRIPTGIATAIGPSIVRYIP